MAGFAHIALGAATGRVLGDSFGRRRWPYLVAGIALAWLPDIDVVWVLLGVCDRGLRGHRGFTHTPIFALAIGLAVAIGLRLRDGARRNVLWAGLVAAALVGSHPVLDALAQDGRGMPSLWPLSMARFHFVWRPIPDAPVGRAFFTRVGLSHLAIELVYFSPLTWIALRRARSRSALAPSRHELARRGLVARLRRRLVGPAALVLARPE